jgi:hypothetical protein
MEKEYRSPVIRREKEFISLDGSNSIKIGWMPDGLNELFRNNIIHDEFDIVIVEDPLRGGEIRSLIDLKKDQAVVSSHRMLSSNKLVCACILDWFGKHDIANMFRMSEIQEISDAFKERVKFLKPY